MTGTGGRQLGNALGLYLHWPYCARICPYCDFNVYRPKGDDEALLSPVSAAPPSPPPSPSTSTSTSWDGA